MRSPQVFTLTFGLSVAAPFMGLLQTACGQDRATARPEDGGAERILDGSAAGAQEASAGGVFASEPPGGGPSVDAGRSVLMHHKNLSRDGVTIDPALTKAAVAGASAADAGSLDGGPAGLHEDTTFAATLPDPNDHVYAQPLFVDGMGGRDLLIVATEANNVYGLDGATGAAVWTTNLGAPVPLATLATCGNIDPYGVTGTPVIDFASRTLFADALVLPTGAGALPKHRIFALSVDTGAVQPGWPVDVETIAASGSTPFDSRFQGQRGALAIVGGTLYVPFGGLYGDCLQYHGWVVSVSISDPTHAQSWATAAPGGGAWAPGGVSSDGSSIYIATGNTFTADGGWGGGDALFRFGTGASFGAPLDSFAPAEWALLDQGDLDMTTAPIPFDLAGSAPQHLVVMFGKTGGVYLLDRDHLGGVGSSLGAPDAGGSITANYNFYATLAGIASSEIITAPALYNTETGIYVALKGIGALCTRGSGDLTTLRIVPGTPPTLAPSWCAAGGTGSPMVTTSDGRADAIVWNLGADDDNFLHAFDGDTGAEIVFPGHAVSIPHMRRYNTPIAAKGRVFVAADNAVVAFTP
jgi:outer membrane protein assembly factor BamB